MADPQKAQDAEQALHERQAQPGNAPPLPHGSQQAASQGAATPTVPQDLPPARVAHDEAVAEREAKESEQARKTEAKVEKRGKTVVAVTHILGTAKPGESLDHLPRKMLETFLRQGDAVERDA